MMYKWRFILMLLAVSVGVFGAAHTVHAADLFFSKTTQSIGVGQSFSVNVLLSTGGLAINALEGTVSIPADLIGHINVSDGSSIVSFWVEHPKVTSDGKITFSGVIPGGYTGNGGVLFSISMTAEHAGTGTVSFIGTKALQNDGSGTQAPLSTRTLQVRISERPAVSSTPLPAFQEGDADAPEPFQPLIAQNPTIFDGKYFLVFATQDKQSGIDHYEVQEGGDDFVRAESPYLLKYQYLDRDIRVKAIDRSGHERIAFVPAIHMRRWITIVIEVGILVIGGSVLIYFLRRIPWRKKQRR